MTNAGAHWRTRSCELGHGGLPLPLGERRVDAAARDRVYTFELDDVACASCGFVFAGRVPPADFLEQYYRNAYTLDSNFATIDRDYDAEARLAMVRSCVRPGASLLEIGAGAADFCDLLCEAGFDATGVDPLDQGRPNSRVTRADHRATSGVYDAVVSYYVLEHVLDANEWLAAVARRLAPNGVAILEVPDFERHPQESLYWEHLRHLTPFHLSELLRRAGLTPVAFDRERPSRYFGFTVVAKPGVFATPSPAPPWPGVEHSRAIYARGRAAQSEEERRAGIVAREVAAIVARHANAAVVVWAVNDIAAAVCRALAAAGITEVRVVDNAAQKINRAHPGVPGMVTAPAPDTLRARHAVFVLCSPAWNAAIAEQVRGFGLPSASIVDAAKMMRGDLVRGRSS